MPALSKWNNRINRWDGVTSIFLSLDRLHHKMFCTLWPFRSFCPNGSNCHLCCFTLCHKASVYLAHSCARIPHGTSTVSFHQVPQVPTYLVGIESVRTQSLPGHGMVSMLSPVIALAAALGSRVLSPFPVATASGCGVPPARQQNFAKWWTDIRPEISANVSWLSIWNQSRPKEDALVQHGCWFPAKESQSCQKKMNSEELQILCFKRLRNQASTAGTFFGTSSFTSS